MKTNKTLKTLPFNRRQFLFLSGLGGFAFLSGQHNLSFAQAGKEEKTAYIAKDYNRLLGMEGFSDTLLKNHFTLYGWTILYEDPLTGRLINFWINEHDMGHPAGCNPVLILDVFEHAFMIDYGLKRPDYIEAFFKNIHWKAVEGRLK